MKTVRIDIHPYSLYDDTVNRAGICALSISGWEYSPGAKRFLKPRGAMLHPLPFKYNGEMLSFMFNQNERGFFYARYEER